MNYGLEAIVSDDQAVQSQGIVLLVSDSSESINLIDNTLSDIGYDVIVSSGASTALNHYSSKHVDFVLIDLDHIDMPGDKLVYSLRSRSKDVYIPIMVIASSGDEAMVTECISAGSDDFMIAPFSTSTLRARLVSLDQVRELKQLYKNSVHEQLVAKQILSYALSERNIRFEEIKLLSRSKAVFSGDLFLMARHPDNCIHVLMADFTGHGLSAAIGALPVADIFSVMTEKGFQPTEILENINSKLHTLLPVSMFMACSLLKIDYQKMYAEIWNAGMPDIYIRSVKTGDIKQTISSSHIPLGISEKFLCDSGWTSIELEVSDQIIMFTDGLTDAVNRNGEMFGYDSIEACMQDSTCVESLFSDIVDSFNRYCGDVVPDDDVTLACIPCSADLTRIDDVADNLQVASNNKSHWCWYMELSGSSIINVDPLPIIMNEAKKIDGIEVDRGKLNSVLKELYDNAISHGLSCVTTPIKDRETVSKHLQDCDGEKNNYLRIGLKKVEHNGNAALLVSLEDSGDGFNFSDVIDQLRDDDSCRRDAVDQNNEGISLVYQLSDSLNYHGNGNRVEAIIS